VSAETERLDTLLDRLCETFGTELCRLGPGATPLVKEIQEMFALHFNVDTDPCGGVIVVPYDDWLAVQREVKQLREINHMYLMEGRRRDR
jgi:hypothetical protein